MSLRGCAGRLRYYETEKLGSPFDSLSYGGHAERTDRLFSGGGADGSPLSMKAWLGVG